MAVKFIKKNNIPKFQSGGKTPEDKAEEKRTYSVTDEDFVQGSGTFNVNEAIKHVNSSSLSDAEKNALTRRMRRMGNRVSSGIDVFKDEEGTIQWRWQDAADGEGRKGGVADSQRASRGVGGKGVAGLSGGMYDRAYDYMVKNGLVNFKGDVKTREKKQEEPAYKPASGDADITLPTYKEAKAGIDKAVDSRLAQENKSNDSGQSKGSNQTKDSKGTGNSRRDPRYDDPYALWRDTTKPENPVNGTEKTPVVEKPDWQGGSRERGYLDPNYTTDVNGNMVIAPRMGINFDMIAKQLTALTGANKGEGYTITDGVKAVFGEGPVTDALEGALTMGMTPGGAVRGGLGNTGKMTLQELESARRSGITQHGLDDIKFDTSSFTKRTRGSKTKSTSGASSKSTSTQQATQNSNASTSPGMSDWYKTVTDRAKQYLNKADEFAVRVNERVRESVKGPPKLQAGGTLPVASSRNPVGRPSLTMPTITDKQINPYHMDRYKPAGNTDGRLGVYNVGPGANYGIHMKAVGTPDRDFQITDLGMERKFDPKYHVRLKPKDLEAIGFNPGVWKDAKQTGTFTQGGKTYPLIERSDQVNQSIQGNKVPDGTGEYKWAASGRKLTRDGVGRQHPYKKKHGL